MSQRCPALRLRANGGGDWDVGRFDLVTAGFGAERRSDQMPRLGFVVVRAAASKAARNCGGSSRPRFSALRRIPAHAVGLKQYRRRWSPVSRMEDSEHSIASLRDAEVASVKRADASEIADFSKRENEGAEVARVLGVPGSADIFPDDPTWSCATSEAHEFEGQLRTRIIQSRSAARDAEPLAGGSSHEKVDCPMSFELLVGDGRHVAEVRDGGEAVREHGVGEGVDLGEPRAFPAERGEGEMVGPDAAAHGRVSEGHAQRLARVQSHARNSSHATDFAATRSQRPGACQRRQRGQRTAVTRRCPARAGTLRARRGSRRTSPCRRPCRDAAPRT